MSNDGVYSISSVRPSLKEEQSSRARRYFISMGIRTVCFAGAAFVEGNARWMMLLLALIVPWVAVIIANDGADRRRVDAQYFQATPELPSAERSTDR